MQVSEVLERSLQTLEDEGWCKTGAYRDGDDRCIVAALWHTISQELEWQDGGRLLMDSCLRVLRGGTGMANIAFWNDHPARTFGQVRETLRRAVAEAERCELVAA